MASNHTQILNYFEKNGSVRTGRLLMAFPELPWNAINEVILELRGSGIIHPVRGYGWVLNA